MRTHVDEKAINGLYNSDPIAKAVFKELSTMPRQDETVLDSMENRLHKAGKQVTRRELVNLFKRLQDFGVGELIVGRKGYSSRFRWSVDSINLSAIDVSFPKPQHPAPVADNLIPDSGPTVLIGHRFQLRPNLVLTIQLPADLTTTEAARLGQFINSLPFDVQTSMQAV